MVKITLDISELISGVFKLPYCNKPDNNFEDRKEIYNYLLTIIPSKIDFSPIELYYLEIGGFDSDDFLHNLRFHQKLYQESLKMYLETGHTDCYHFYVDDKNCKEIESKINNIKYGIKQMTKYCDQLTDFSNKLHEFELSVNKNKFDIYASLKVKNSWYRFIVAYQNAGLIITGLDSNVLESLRLDLLNQIRSDLSVS
ncbi:MAG: hypothetical protein ACI4JW_03680 [Oscillospiraceae bacterium]